MGISVVTTGGLLGVSDPSGAKRHILQTAHTLVAHPVRRMTFSLSNRSNRLGAISLYFT